MSIKICNVCVFPQDDIVGMFADGEECPQCENIYPKAKAWFQDITEADLELMISMGVITKSQVIKMYIRENAATA